MSQSVPHMPQCPGVLLNNTEIPWVLGGDTGGDTGLPVVLEGSHGCSGCWESQEGCQTTQKVCACLEETQGLRGCLGSQKFWEMGWGAAGSRGTLR